MTEPEKLAARWLADVSQTEAPISDALKQIWEKVDQMIGPQRMETEAEHIARDMREGRFPKRSDPIQVPVAEPDALARHLAPGDDLVAQATATAECDHVLLVAAEAENATLRDRLARMEGDAEWQDKQRRDAFARRHLSAPEDPHVYILCERYGYGAVMDAASRLWARKDSMGAFYIGGCIGIKPTDTAEGGDR